MIFLRLRCADEADKNASNKRGRFIRKNHMGLFFVEI